MATVERTVERAVLRNVLIMGRSIAATLDTSRASIECAVRTGVCARNAASEAAMRTETLLRAAGGAAALARAQLEARAHTVDEGFAWVRQLGAHANALNHFQRTAAFAPARRPAGLRLRVGQLVAHTHFHADASRGSGVVYGWTEGCDAAVGGHESVADGALVDNRQRFARIDRARQPYYRLLTRGGESRLVAEELLAALLPGDPLAELPVQGASYFFARILYSGQYTPNQWLCDAYPDDVRAAAADAEARATSRGERCQR
jgi:hypothetical protein